MSRETLNRRVLLRISLVIIAPILALLLIELVMRMYGVFEIHALLQARLSAEQAHVIRKQVFLAAIAIVLLVCVGLMTYGISSVFEIYGQEPARDSRRK
jgi:hypothetical protein